MSLAAMLRPLIAFDGLVAIVIMTRDGLPVEMVGHGLRADLLAAELTSIAESARLGCGTLGMGTPDSLHLDLPRHRIAIHKVGYYYMAVVLEPRGDMSLIPQIIEQTKPQLIEALGG